MRTLSEWKMRGEMVSGAVTHTHHGFIQTLWPGKNGHNVRG